LKYIVDLTIIEKNKILAFTKKL